MTEVNTESRAEFEAWWSTPALWSHGHKEAQWAAWQAASASVVPSAKDSLTTPTVNQQLTVPAFTSTAKSKLTELLERGWRITGYAIERESDGATERGFINHGGFVGWWRPKADHFRDATKMVADDDRLRNLLCKLIDQLASRKKHLDGNAPGHAHSILGVWDSDNGALSGKKCAWCELWQEALAVHTAAQDKQGGAAS